ncbi:unnamed protein product [Sympodiomycopsis kandeliae]
MDQQSESSLPLVSRVIPPSPEEANGYYYGLTSRPKLIARASSGTVIWSIIQGQWTRPPHRTLLPLYDADVCEAWEQVLDDVVSILRHQKVPWQIIDVVKMLQQGSQTAAGVVWIGCLPDQCSFEQAAAVIHALQILFVSFPALQKLDIQLRESCVKTLGWLREGTLRNDITSPFLSGIGAPICPSALPHCEGTGAVFLSSKTATGESETFLLTARHVVCHSGDKAILRPTDDEKTKVSLVGSATWARLPQMLDDARLDIAQDIQDHGPSQQMTRAAEALQQVESLAKSRRQAVDRIIGDVIFSPPLQAGIPFTEDWALVRVEDAALIPGCNQLYLGDKMRASEMRTRMHPHISCRPNTFKMPPGSLLAVGGILDAKDLTSPSRALDAESEPALMVLKRGSATGVTIGRGNGIWSARRVISAAGREQTSREWLILGETRNQAFADKGDSGSAVVDGQGKVGGIVTAGDDPNGDGRGVDLTYATPMWWLLERIKAYTGRDFHVLRRRGHPTFTRRVCIVSQRQRRWLLVASSDIGQTANGAQAMNKESPAQPQASDPQGDTTTTTTTTMPSPPPPSQDEQQQGQQQPSSSSLSHSDTKSSLADNSASTAVVSVRKRSKLPSGTSTPRSILKPAPPPQKPFSFRRDILQSLNTRLAQQGVNVQVPVTTTANTTAAAAQGAANLLGGMFKRIGGTIANNNMPVTTTTTLDPSTEPPPASLPATEQQDSSLVTPPPQLKRVQFNVAHIAVTYPMGTGPPASEDATRLATERTFRQLLRNRTPRDFTPRQLEELYMTCCRTREEHPLKKMRLIFAQAHQQQEQLTTLDLSMLPLDRQAIDPIADLLCIDFGLQKLLLENCSLTDDGLKAILHALLVSGTLPSLSIASNPRIRFTGWRYLAAFIKRARNLKYLDLSENNINRASIESIAAAIRRPPHQVTRDPNSTTNNTTASTTASTITDQPLPSLDDDDDYPLIPPAHLLLPHRSSTPDQEQACAILSLRLENCALRGRTLSLLAPAVRFSDLKHISLRRNRINQMGAVALAIMLKDYPDASPAANQIDGLTAQDTPTNGDLQPQQPIVTSSPAGGMTVRKPYPSTTQQTEAEAIALHRAKKAKRILGTMPRIGSLLTLDLKSNDVRGGVVYLAQVLRKNRTLRVLNLSDNNIDMQGLVAIADALKYNSTLETLDMSHNPCSGPALEGITTLRQAFTLNSNLKRLFLNDTDLSSEGAIALAEFLPEARSLIHLDLTENFEIEIAGVMALAVSVRLNKSLRCLDLNIPPNDPDFARLSQEILQSCIRNTEAAQKKAAQKGLRQPVAAPIYKSVVARAAHQKQERQRAMEATKRAEEQASIADAQQDKNRATALQSYEKLLEAAQTCLGVLEDLLKSEQERRAQEEERAAKNGGDDAPAPLEPPPRDFVSDLVAQSNRLRAKLGKAVTVMGEGDMLQRALGVNDELDRVTASLVSLYREARNASSRQPTTANASSPNGGQAMYNSNGGQTSPSPNGAQRLLSPRAASKARARDPEDDGDDGLNHLNGSFATMTPSSSRGSDIGAAGGGMATSSSGDSLSAPVIESSLSSPSFSIGSDDEDDDAEELDNRIDAKGIAAKRNDGNVKGLFINDGGEDDPPEQDNEEQQQTMMVAEKEALPELSPSSPRGAVETKAREMVDEEGEIFRRARSLAAENEQEEEEEEDKQGAGEQTTSDDGIREDQSESPSDGHNASHSHAEQSITPSADDDASSQQSKPAATSGPDPNAEHAENGHIDIGDADTSGDELRRRLLAADLPRGVTSPGSTGEEGEADKCIGSNA